MAGEQLADLYVEFRALTAPAVTGMGEFGAAGERMAVQVDAAVKTVDTAVKGLGVEMQAAATRMAAASTEMAAANDRMAASFAPVAAGAKTAAAEVDAAETGMAAKASEAAATITADDDKILASMRALVAEAKASTDAVAVSYDHMAAQIKLGAAEIEAADAKAAASTEVLAAKTDLAGKSAAAGGLLANKGFMTAAAGAAIAGGEAIKMAGNFQASTDVFTTTAGEDVRNMDMIRAGMLQLSTDTGTGAEKMVAAMYKVESSHIHGAAALNVLKAAAQGAKIENSDLTKTADALTTTMTDFHFPTEQAALVMSKLVAVAGSGKLTMEEMAGSLHSVELVAAQSGLSIEQVGGALATMTMHGATADQATQNLRNAIQNLEAPNQVAIKEMAGLGINALDLSSHLGERGLTGTYKILTEAIAAHTQNGHVVLEMYNTSSQAADKAKRALSGLPPELQKVGQAFLDGKGSIGEFQKEARGLKDNIGGERAKEFETLANKAHGFSDALKSGNPDVTSYVDALKRSTGGTVGLGIALGLTGENAKSFDESIKAITDATPQADGAVRGWEETQKRFNTQMDRAKEGVKNLAISIGSILLPAVTPVVAAIANLTDFFSKHAVAAHILAVVIGVILVTAFLSLAAKGAAALLKLSASFFTNAADAAVWLLRKLGILAAAEAATVAEAEAETAAQSRSSLAVLASATGNGAKWVAVKIGQYVAVSASAVAESAVAVGAWIASEVKMAGEAIAKGAVWVAAKIAQYTGVSIASVVAADAATAAWTAADVAAVIATGGIILAVAAIIAIAVLVVTHWQQVKDFFIGLWDSIKAAFAGAVAFFKRAWDDIAGGFENAKAKIGDTVSAIDGFFLGIGAAIGSVVAWFVDLPGKIDDALKPIVEVLTAPFRFAWDAIKFMSTHSPAEVGHAVGEALGKATRAAWDWANNFGDAINRGISATPGAVARWATDFGASVNKGLDTAIHGADDWATKFGAAVNRGISATPSTVAKWSDSFGTSVNNGLDKTIHAVVTWATNFGTGINNGITAALQWFAGLPARIMAFFAGAPHWLYQTGVDILTGLWNGITSFFGTIRSGITGFIGGFIDGFKSGFGVSSPSTIFLAIGGDIIQGLWNGAVNIWNGFNSYFHGLPQQIIGVFAAAGSWLVSAGGDLIRGLWNGFQSLASWMYNAAVAWATAILNGVKAALGIASPSQHTHEMGRNLVQGLAAGIDASTHLAVAAAKTMTGQVLSAMSGMDATATVGVRVGGDGASLAVTAGVSPAAATAGGGSTAGGDTHVHLTVQGSIWTTKDLIAEVQQELLRHGIRNVGNATNYSFG